ncbi:MAG: hypothetical protein JWL95_218 [Gemmatimonadetes bacterium]|nr:hypothetical protein [Gemmatimonadota bacterium]
MLNTTRSIAAVSSLLFAATISADAQRTPTLRGIWFAVDTLESPPAWRGALTRVAGVVEFAAGRGRLSVTALRAGPAVALNGVTVSAPSAKPGDYYLFDGTGFVLVRPATRTFSAFVMTRADFNHTGALLPGAFLMKYTPLHTDTLAAGDVARLTQHAPVSIHWHLDSLDERGPSRVYARGWLELEDAPAIEAGVARWFGVASAIASIPGGVGALPRDKLRVTTIALLRRPGQNDFQVRYLALVRPVGLSAADVDPGRLVLPANYHETRWPGFEHASAMRAPSRNTRTKWRTLPGVITK